MNLDFAIVFIALLLSVILSLVISLASFTLGENTPDNEKVTSYECGFNPIHIPGEPFSISFFLIAILFSVFDLEISYLIPWSSCSNIIDSNGQIVIILFISVLTIGLIYDWVNGGLEWE